MYGSFVVISVNYSAHFVSLSTVANPVQNSLYRLYTSAQDGLSFNRLSFHILGYTGPTLVVIKDTEGGKP